MKTALARCAVAFVLCGMLAYHGANAQNATSEAPPDVSLLLCQDGIAPGFDDEVKSALIRTLTLSGTIKSAVIRARQCGAQMPDATCFAGPHALACRSVALVRMLRASAWLVSTYIDSPAPNYEDFRKANVRAVASAFQYADGQIADGRTDAEVAKMRALQAGHTVVNGLTSDSTSRFTKMYQAVVDYNLATLIGHELSHVFGERCPIDAKSLAETSGLFSVVRTSQTSGSLFCPRDPSLFEVRADVCGLRHIRALDERLVANESVSDRDLDFVRRAASDMVAFEAVTGWRKLEGVAKGHYFILPQVEYLYGPFRALLFASEIHGTRTPPAICGEAAAIFVRSVQETYKHCGDRDGAHAGGIVPDEILAEFPKGLEASWNGKPWTDESYACQQR